MTDSSSAYREFPDQSPIDEAFEALADPYRRRLINELFELGSTGVDVVHIPEDVSTEQTDEESLTVEMHHVHLPKLETEGFVDWDRTRNHVVRGPEFDAIETAVELFEPP